MPEAALLKTFFTLLIAVAALGGLLFIVKKISRRSASARDNVGLEVVSRLNLQQKSQLFVVKAAGRTLLIGATDRSINTLADLTDESREKSELQTGKDFTFDKKIKPDQLRAIKMAASKGGSDQLSFASFLKSTLGKS
ncbi:MAG: FliO/MopB family protein [Candidatus Kapaibacterium sp.]